MIDGWMDGWMDGLIDRFVVGLKVEGVQKNRSREIPDMEVRKEPQKVGYKE